MDPNGFPAVPFVENWTEIDLDTLSSTNTGVFANTPAGSPDHIVNAHGSQLAFLGSQTGNALEQDLDSTYKIGCDYQLTVAVGVSGRFPPSSAEPVDTFELVLYYRDANEPVDVVHQAVEATGLSVTQLTDFSLYLPTVQSGDAWAGMAIGVALRANGMPGGFWDLDHVRLIESPPVSIPIENASFEAPTMDPNGFPAVPFVDNWTEIDLDTLSSTNTGVFANTQPGSSDHIVNAHGSQLAFLGSQTGNALEQDLAATYKIGCDYQLTVAVGVSGRFPPSSAEPVDAFELVLYYRNANEPVDIVRQAVEATGLSVTQLTDFSLYLPTVQPGDACAGMAIGVALRANGMPGGFWDLDHVRLIESPPVSIPIENASFEAPVVDPNGFPAVPYVDNWTEIDLDTLSSTNTGVFANTQPGSSDHIVNAHGSQLAFLGSQTGNALEQDLDITYKIGCDYQLTVAVGVSGRFPPSSAEPADAFELVLYYRDANEPVDIVRQAIEATGLSVTQLTDVSLYLPTVQPGDAWAGMAIGVALRANGMPGGFWDLDHVRLIESFPGPELALTVKE
ncbi:MAG TPA: hypothetical protein VMW72_03925 [Sedimentisphaerales bacterium]|nr:hypothetical protein [Sedimentisphaerales bacterium]